MYASGAVITNYYYYGSPRIHVHRAQFNGLSLLGFVPLRFARDMKIISETKNRNYHIYRYKRNANSWLLARHQIHYQRQS